MDPGHFNLIRLGREMLKMSVDIAGLGIDIHKWAALEKTQIFPVKPVVHMAFVRVIVAALLLLPVIFALK